MPTLILRTLVLLLSFASAWAVPTIFIDDSDSRILYSGTWAKNPISDPENLNYDGTLTYTNDATAKATFTFSGAVQVMVFGSFPVAGTFPMHSQYTIDGAGLTQYEPPSVISHPEYRQHFFTSNTISTGTHTLVIANLGRAFYLDGIVLTLPASSSSLLPSSTATHSTGPSVPSMSTSSRPLATSPPAQPAESTTVFVVTAGLPSTAPPTTQPSQSASFIYSASISSNSVTSPPPSTVSSIDASGSTPTLASTTQNASSQVTSTGTSHRSEFAALPAGVYVAIGVGGFTVVVLTVVGLCFLRRRRRHRNISSDVSPFDSGLTSLASQKSDLSPRTHAPVNRVSSIASTLYHSAPPYTPIDESRTTDSIGHGTSEGDVLHIVPDERGAHADIATYEPLGSPSAMSPLVPCHFEGYHGHRDTLSPSAFSPISPVSDSKRARHYTHEFRRRSLDGGVRLAGGPSGPGRDANLTDIDARSAVSTLPPLYDAHAAP